MLPAPLSTFLFFNMLKSIIIKRKLWSTDFVSLIERSKARRARLEEARNYFQFAEDHEDEEAWIVEKQRICQAGISAKDLTQVIRLQQKHKVCLWIFKMNLKSFHYIQISEDYYKDLWFMWYSYWKMRWNLAIINVSKWWMQVRL